MARIRTVKPEFFRHETLQDIELAHPGSYAMLVFEALWGHCDNKGRFEWRPRQLKLDILPFLPFDMTTTLSILEQYEMIQSYEVCEKLYGFIPSFLKHQRISGKEVTEGERFPEPPNSTPGSNGEATGKQRGSVGDEQEFQEGKGREGKGKGTKPPIQGGDGNYGVRTPGASVDPETGEITPFDNIVPLAGRA